MNAEAKFAARDQAIEDARDEAGIPVLDINDPESVKAFQAFVQGR